MPTAVLDIDFEKIPEEITGLDCYSSALVLIRVGGRPVARINVPVVNGRVNGAELCDAIRAAADRTFWEQWLKTRTSWEENRPAGRPGSAATVAICTRDRPKDLKRCLDALMRLPDDGQEIIVIDNCPSSQNTCLLVQEYPRVRYLREDRPGLNHARNRALCEARHGIVAFTDDDAVVDPGWLRSLLSNFDDEMVLCVTGLVMPLELETDAQEQFERHTPFGRGFRRQHFDRSNHPPLAGGAVGVGASMALRRSVLDRVGPFNPALDAGTETKSGGDNEMFSRIMIAGYRIIYDPAALSWHCHRRSMAELKRTRYGYGVGVYAAWTSQLLNQREWAVIYLAVQWFYHVQFPALWRSLWHTVDSTPLELIVAELAGCLAGPWAFIRSSRKLQKEIPNVHPSTPEHRHSNA